jgi:phospholipid/cholesterol/gamma-HCH transport system substrate-binding protein
MSESNRKTEMLVGVFILIGLSLLGGLIVQFGRFSDRIRGKYQFTVVFSDASGLIKGSEVRMGGARIGKVAAQPLLNENVKVEVILSVDNAIHVPKDSTIQIASATILGDKMIVITPPAKHTTEYIAPGTILLGGGPSGLDAIQNNAEAVSRDARKLMEDAGTTFVKVDAAVENIRIVAERLNVTLDKVNSSILSQQNLSNIDGTIDNLQKTTGEWAKASAALTPAIQDARQAIASIQKAADGAQGTFAGASQRIDELKPAVDRITDAATRASNTFERVERGEGLLGTLAYDKEISNDAKVFIRNLKQQGILRYRDKETPEEDPRTRFQGRRR